MFICLFTLPPSQRRALRVADLSSVSLAMRSSSACSIIRFNTPTIGPASWRADAGLTYPLACAQCACRSWVPSSSFCLTVPLVHFRSICGSLRCRRSVKRLTNSFLCLCGNSCLCYVSLHPFPRFQSTPFLWPMLRRRWQTFLIPFDQIHSIPSLNTSSIGFGRWERRYSITSRSRSGGRWSSLPPIWSHITIARCIGRLEVVALLFCSLLSVLKVRPQVGPLSNPVRRDIRPRSL
jgi:hypothetical protein